MATTETKIVGMATVNSQRPSVVSQDGKGWFSSVGEGEKKKRKKSQTLDTQLHSNNVIIELPHGLF